MRVITDKELRKGWEQGDLLQTENCGYHRQRTAERLGSRRVITDRELRKGWNPEELSQTENCEKAGIKESYHRQRTAKRLYDQGKLSQTEKARGKGWG